MIFVGGTSSSGKSTTIAHLVETHPRFRHVSASRLLGEYGRPLRPITDDEADENQEVLARILTGLPLDDRAWMLLDGHAMIETVTGLRPVPDDWFARVGFSGLAHIEAASGLVAERRRRRLHSSWTSSIVRRAQTSERAALRRQAGLLSVPFLSVKSGDAEALAAWASTVVSSTSTVGEDR